MTVLITVVVVLAVVALLALWLSPRVIKQYVQGVPSRPAKVRGGREAGLTVVVPLVDVRRPMSLQVPSLQARSAHLWQEMVDHRVRARAWTREHGEDSPAVSGWTWPE